MTARFALTGQDLIDKLEEIALDDRNRAAQLAAIKHLQVLRGETEQEESKDGFGKLYAVER